MVSEAHKTPRKRRLIIHAGMHKTGSTAIQHWLHTARLDDVHYFNWRSANHSELFVLLFEDEPQKYFTLSNEHYSKADAMRERAREQDSIRRQIETSDREVFIFSAERISAAPDAAVQRMHDFFAGFFDEIEVHAYVRKPSGFMTSMFQQHLKTGRIKFGFATLWPGYKRRLGRLFEIFGEDHVHLRSFDRLVESGTEAVRDFAGWVGMTSVPPGNIVRNTSLSATGVALLYYYRDIIEPGLPLPDRRRFERRILGIVQHLPGERFHLDLIPNQRQLGWSAWDLKWINGRTGFDLAVRDAPPEGARVFRTEQEIFDHAVETSHLLLPERRWPALAPGAAGRAETERRFHKALRQRAWVRHLAGLWPGRRRG